MSFYADLHVHSRYSRATSRECDLEHLSVWAQKKGITVLGTGDFTHPAWLSEIAEKLESAEPGLFRLRAEKSLPAEATHEATRFLLSVEIATIYKKGDRTRKVHHVILMPGLDHVRRFVERLSRIGNLNADGRPILGVDSRDLLEIALEAGEGAYLIPAHIWTPWFSALGSKSGFDCIEDCYGDLAGHIFALETGLSSDPPMNWRLSALDRYRLVSNSDAHSPAKLGREACVFDCELDYFAMKRALETGRGYAGTVEFFPEEGKYHLDGHRNCGACLTPDETRKNKGKCPVCGKPVTVGVMHRVEELADRGEGARSKSGAPFRSLIPLIEILAELEGTGTSSKRVAAEYEKLVTRLGPELVILEQAPLEEVRRQGSELLAEALRRMREGQVIRDAGYDGEYGTIRLFGPGEIERAGGSSLFPDDDAGPPRNVKKAHKSASDSDLVAPFTPPDDPPVSAAAEAAPRYDHDGDPLLDALDPDQRAAAEIMDGPLLIIAGPGTGKTRTLTHRLAHVIGRRGVQPESCLAITFTRRAAAEMSERLAALLPDAAERIPVLTFHALGLSLLREQGRHVGLAPGFTVVAERDRQALLAEAMAIAPHKAARLVEMIAGCKRRCEPPEPDSEIGPAFEAYRKALGARGAVDFEDLIALPVQLLEADCDLAETYRRRYRWIAIDEYQDLDALQYRLVRLLAPPDGNVCAIGDPNQAIYGFRGADVTFFHRFQKDFPAAKVVRLTRCYRCSRTILDASGQVAAGSEKRTASEGVERRLEALMDSPERIVVHDAATERAEAEFVVHSIEQVLGGHTFFSLDTGRSAGHADGAYTFSDFAVLYRFDAQADAVCEALARSGIPYQKRSHQRLAERPGVARLVERMKALRGGEAASALLHRAADDLLEQDASPSTEAAASAALLEPLATQCGEDVARFFDLLALGEEVDSWDPRAERVSLLTLHAAKGLEFSVVFIVGCEDGILPLKWGGRIEASAYDEERRLFYVGMTRARERLFLCRARSRFGRGKVRQTAPSPFLTEIEERLLDRRASKLRPKDKKPPDTQMELFQ